MGLAAPGGLPLKGCVLVIANWPYGPPWRGNPRQVSAAGMPCPSLLQEDVAICDMTRHIATPACLILLGALWRVFDAEP